MHKEASHEKENFHIFYDCRAHHRIDGVWQQDRTRQEYPPATSEQQKQTEATAGVGGVGEKAPEASANQSEEPKTETPAEGTTSNAQAQGQVGDDVMWYYQDGVITYKGTGDMDYMKLITGEYRDPAEGEMTKEEITRAIFEGGHGGMPIQEIKSAVIEEGITSIIDFAFNGFTNLTSVTIPGSVTEIRPFAFSNCTSLTSVTIPDSVTKIWDNAFSGCTSLTSITIPDGVTKIDTRTFQDCTSLASVTIPDSVTEIAPGAFGNCTSLTSVTIPDSITEIWGGFNDCTNLTSITIPDSVTYIYPPAFIGCTSLDEPTKAKITSIQPNAQF